MKDLKEHILTEMFRKWQFETNRPINDIPIALYEKETGTRSVYIPFEVLDYHDFEKLESQIQKYEKVYLLDKNQHLEIIDFDEFEIENQLNVTLIAPDISWLINISVMFTGIGIAVSFAGDEMIEFAHQAFSHKDKWLFQW